MKRFKIILLTIAAVGIAVFFVWEKGYVERLKTGVLGLKKSAEVTTEKLKKDISMPGPLRLLHDAPQSVLTQSGVVNWTNVQRANFNLSALRQSPKLNEAARLKVNDMFTRQYFEHVSPTGGDISNLAQAVSYEYLNIGENLALGNYENDQAVVQAWMDSPGHRANILNAKFTEIGVAVLRGQFEGKTTWLAAQVFARPLASCPQPDATLKAQIAILETQVDSFKREAEHKLYEIENAHPSANRRNDPEYNQKVDEYNTLIEQINAKIAELKILVSQYNEQVRLFNTCASG